MKRLLLLSLFTITAAYSLDELKYARLAEAITISDAHAFDRIQNRESFSTKQKEVLTQLAQERVHILEKYNPAREPIAISCYIISALGCVIGYVTQAPEVMNGVAAGVLTFGLINGILEYAKNDEKLDHAHQILQNLKKK